MENLIVFGLVAAWFAVGFASHVYWVTNQYDYTSDQLANGVLAAMCGPLSWFIGWAVYGTPSESIKRTLFRRRSR